MGLRLRIRRHLIPISKIKKKRKNVTTENWERIWKFLRLLMTLVQGFRFFTRTARSCDDWWNDILKKSKRSVDTNPFGFPISRRENYMRHPGIWINMTQCIHQ